MRESNPSRTSTVRIGEAFTLLLLRLSHYLSRHHGASTRQSTRRTSGEDGREERGEDRPSVYPAGEGSPHSRPRRSIWIDLPAWNESCEPGRAARGRMPRGSTRERGLRVCGAAGKGRPVRRGVGCGGLNSELGTVGFGGKKAQRVRIEGGPVWSSKEVSRSTSELK